MRYLLTIEKPALRSLSRVLLRDRERLIKAIDALAIEPRPPGCKKLSGREAWRIRVGMFRVIYEIFDSELRILIVDVGHRKEIYR